MLYIAGFPGKYIQGSGALDQLDTVLAGRSAVMVCDDFVWNLAGKAAADKAGDNSARIVRHPFQGETTQWELDKLLDTCRKESVNYIIGMGGGKAMDTARAGAFFSGLPLIIVPTTASTDAPCSSLTGIYSDQHEHLKTIRTGKNPDIVLVDSAIILGAPKMSFVHGMGDALATYFEADAVFRSGRENGHGGRSLRMGMALCRLCLDTVLDHGLEALEAFNKKQITPAFEAVLEANVLLSGVGFESGGLAAAHGLHAAMTADPAFAPAPHGMKVAFCTLVQLIMETTMGIDRTGYIKQLVPFYLACGLPCCAADFGLETDQADLRTRYARMAEKALGNPNNHIHRMPFAMDTSLLVDSMLATSELKHAYS